MGDDSCPAGQPCTNIFALPSSHNISQKSSLSDIFTPKESNIFDGLLGKRPLVDKKDCGVNPNAIFQVIKSYTDPLPKRPKLCESTDFLIFPELPAKEYEQIQTHDNEPTTIDSNVQNYPSPLSPDNSDENEQMQDELEELFEPYPLITDVKKQKVTSSSASPLQTDSIPIGTGDTKVSVEISFGKRGNGNQPWQQSSSTPSKIGKMRRMTFDLTSNSSTSKVFQVRIRTIDNQPKMHKGKLVLCSDDRCCVKKKVEGRKKPVIECHERLTEIILPEVSVSSSSSSTVEAYLKPEWNGLGANKTRPNFDVIVELVDCETGRVQQILEWETELQSHKFESSPKAKQMENAAGLNSVIRDVQF